MNKSHKLQLLNGVVGACVKCEELANSRTHTVFGEGNPDSELVFCGEAPGQNEDETGRPFVGRAGQLLDQIIASMGYARESVYILNVIKCRPPNNRVPFPEEAANCRPFFDLQLKTIGAKYAVCLGKTASYYMLKSEGSMAGYSMGFYRGKLHEVDGMKVVCTYHPSYVLRSGGSDAVKQEVWKDLQIILAEIEKDKNP